MTYKDSTIYTDNQRLHHIGQSANVCLGKFEAGKHPLVALKDKTTIISLTQRMKS
jgi:hypothetical protein